MSDNRKFKRVNFREPVLLNVAKEAREGGGHLGYDLSEGGLRFYSEDFLPLDAEAYIKFSVDDNKVVELKAKVAWVHKVPHAEGYQIGLKFVDTDAAIQHKDRVRQFIGSL